MVRVKICGITNRRDLETAVAAGADALGFVVDVPSSPRNLKAEEAETLMKHTPVFISKVLVTVPENSYSLISLCERLRPDALQVHEVYDIDALCKKPLHPKLIMAVNEKTLNSPHINSEFANFDAVLIDSVVEGKQGGTGTIHDWSVSRSLRVRIKPKPLILAGGLNPDNVKSAIQTVQPYAVDVSTGVEMEPGLKDPEKVFEFISKAKEVAL